MSAATATAVEQRPGTSLELSEGSGWSLLASPWIWGGLLTWGVYQLVPYTGDSRELLERYLCGHPLEYVQATLFFVGTAILLGRAWRLSVEGQSAALPLPVAPGTTDSRAATSAIQHGLSQLPRRLRKTWYAERLAELAEYLWYRPSADNLERHAQRLSESAAERQHDGYAQLQTITWAIPILGFLGTVMGITLAIANVTPEQLDTSLNSVTGGLAVAFDTTAVALSQSIVIVFAAFFVRRAESRLLTAIDEKVFKGLVTPLAGAAQQADPILEAETRAARELLTRTEALIEQQTGLWQESVEGLRERWSRTLEVQQQELAAALTSGVQSTVGQHADLLAGLRQEFLNAYQHISRETLRQFTESQSQLAGQQHELRAAWEQAWNGIRQELQAERDARSQETRQMLGTFREHMETAAQQLGDATASVEVQLAAVARQTEELVSLAGQSEQLADLQERLTENLDAVRTAETMQETLHSLNAAIHLLMARAKPKAA